MMKKSLKTTLKLICVIPLIFISCKSSEFAGGSEKKPAAPSPSPTPGVTGLPATPLDCLKSKAGTYNTVLVFDRSSSMNSTDPGLIRQQGALQFVQKFLEYKQSNPSATINIATAAFSDGAIRGANGWVDLKPETAGLVAADIQTATVNPSGGTKYSAGFQLANSLFAEKGVTSQAPSANGSVSHLNYVVFLTDGAPQDPGAYTAIVSQMISTYQTAIFAMAVGQSLNATGSSVVQALALPTVGNPIPSHKGAYFRAAQPADVATAWQQVFTAIASCN